MIRPLVVFAFSLAAAFVAMPEGRAAETKPAAKPDAAIAQFEAQFAAAPWGYGWTHTLEKVFRKDRPFQGRVGGKLQVELAANEYEGVQLVLRSRRPAKNVRVQVSDLKADGGRILPARQIEVLPVGYVNTKRPPYAVDYVGWWPDPLLDYLAAFDLDAGVWQPVWLDLHTPADQPAGVYRGTVRVTADNMPPLEIPLEATVWDFAVPTEYHFPLAVAFHEHVMQSVYSKDPAEWAKFTAYCDGKGGEEALGSGEAKRLLTIRRKCHDLILAHHLIPDNIYRAAPPRIEEVQSWKARGARWFNILHVSSVDRLKWGDPYPAEAKRQILATLADYVPKLEKAGLRSMAYIYGFDEVEPNQFAAVKDIFGEIKRRWPGIPLMTTAYDHSYGRATGLDPYVDIWVPKTSKYNETPEAIAAARARGRQVWWYVCCEPHHPYANWFVEYTAAEHRLLMGFMPQKFACQGFLHYSMNHWKTHQTVRLPDGRTVREDNGPFREPVRGGPLTTSDGKSWSDFNGDGLIFYPGPDGPLGTIRMKCIRDGLEDYEYLWLLNERLAAAKRGAWRPAAGWTRRAEAALAVSPTLVRSLTQYSTRGDDLLAARREIAALLIQR